MRMSFLIYCEVADNAVISAIKKAGIKGYTKLEEAQGEGTETEPKLGTHCWPGKNNLLLMALDDGQVQGVRDMVRKLKRDHPRAGLRGFLLPLEECI
jgi:hypothetical protein